MDSALKQDQMFGEGNYWAAKARTSQGVQLPRENFEFLELGNTAYLET